MAQTPQIKVYNPAGEYVAACVHAEEAGCLAAFLGDGATLRDGHAKRDIFWTEGPDSRAGNSYDAVAQSLVDFRASAARKFEERCAAQALRLKDQAAGTGIAQAIMARHGRNPFGSKP